MKCPQKISSSAEKSHARPWLQVAWVTPAHRSRSAYTLLEILLVLAVLGVLAAIVAPSALRRLADSTMISSADEICKLLSEARMMAMEAGEPAEFRYQPGGNHFLVTTRTGIADAALTSGNSSSAATPVDNTGQPVATGPLNAWTRSRSIGGHLASPVRFANPTPTFREQSLAQTVSENLIADLENASELSQVRWSEPLVFQPDGTTIDQQFKISDASGRTIRIRVRGLTGSATMSAMTIEDPSTMENSSPRFEP
ncbi:hypothetical protein Plim_3636 [Planctopirus limnophila DSM 3776]|uniref:Prepilin-type N-terminal cleavage/methylation domain-containing protein n=1 Tax=Planctopirus limnophila (strain ATCC 43296 / DSM 3776 / IFAM 1008 / Mu 290) TaxID=521674 RepID=D5SVT8_PLAL2|nr:prepilin-type N-terminal cleavage/methylation domain-containing protein [Planctopirus limnophila]ADG69448.1 hypothetical protein Plim_3636 [Planctopirus limnophila DSM 3776]